MADERISGSSFKSLQAELYHEPGEAKVCETTLEAETFLVRTAGGGVSSWKPISNEPDELILGMMAVLFK